MTALGSRVRGLGPTLDPPHLPFDAEAPGVIDDALAYPRNGLRGSIRGVAEDRQSWGVQGSFAYPIDACRGRERW